MKLKKGKILLCIIFCFFIYIASNIISICAYSREYDDQKGDVAIVLGAASTNDEVSEVYKQRLNHAIDLYKENKVQCILTTGGIGKGNSIADSEVAEKYLMNAGISKNVILTETESTITQENLENARKIMDNYNYKTALIVSDPLHMKRAMLLAKDAGIKAYTSPTKTSAYKSMKTKIPFVARETFFYIGYKWYRCL